MLTQVYPLVVVGTSGVDSRIVATLQTILQKPGHLQDPGQGGIEIAQMQLQLLMTPFNLLRWWQNKNTKSPKD